MAISRRWLRFSLRSFIVVLTIGCVWLASFARHIKEERDAIDMIRRAYGSVEYEPTLMSRLGLNQGRPTTAFFLYADAERIDFRKLQTLTSLQKIDFTGTPICDKDISYLVAMTHLETINLMDTHVSRSGILRLSKALPNAVIGCDSMWCTVELSYRGVSIVETDQLKPQVPPWEPPQNAIRDRQEQKALLDSLGPSLGESNE